MTRFTTFILALLLAGGCASLRGVAGSAAEPFDFASTTWQLIELKGAAVEAAAESYTLIFRADNELGGRGSCNLLMGSYAQSNDGSLRLSPRGLTRAACPDMAGEMRYIQMLEEVRSYRIEEEVLILQSDSTVIARLKQQELR